MSSENRSAAFCFGPLSHVGQKRLAGLQGWLAICLAAVQLQPLLADEDWRQFRGPDGQGHAADASTPIEFGESDSMRWRTAIDGKGWSSPVHSNGRIWLTTAIVTEATEEEQAKKLGDDPLKGIKEVAGSVELRAICLDAGTGRVVHNLTLSLIDDPEPINPLNTYASPTPVLDEGRVFCDFGNYGTWCLDAATGETIWKQQTVVDYSVGPGSSPFVLDDLLILICDGVDQQFVLARDKRTGNEVWRTARPPMRATNVEFKKAYSTPIVITVNGQVQIVVPTAQWVCAYDPQDGREIWRADHGSGFSLSPRPVFAEGLVIFSTGYMRPELVAVRPDGKGDVTSSHIAWRVSRGVPTKPSPIVVGDRLYMVSDDGILTQLRVADGETVWKERLGGNFSASPILANGLLYFCSHEGEVTLVRPGDTYDEVAQNTLEGRLLASPAVVGDDLLIRSEFALMRIGN